MIADMDECRPFAQFFCESSPEEKKLIQVTEPFRNETTGITETAEEGGRLYELRGNPGRGQSQQHHHGKPLHALLSIERVITD
jgi:hypothetical protein